MTHAAERTTLWCYTDERALEQIQHLKSDSDLALSVQTILLGIDSRAVFSITPSVTLRAVLASCPNVRSVELCNSIPHLPLHISARGTFRTLESFTVNFPTHFIDYGATTIALFNLFVDMPALKRLVIWDTMSGPQREVTDADSEDLPTPAFSLTQFWYCGLLSVRAAAKIILRSKATLSKLNVYLPALLPHHDDSSLYVAMAEAAPSLKEFMFRSDGSAVPQDTLIAALRGVFPRLTYVQELTLCIDPYLPCAGVAELISLISSRAALIRLLTLRHLNARDVATDLGRVLKLQHLRGLRILELQFPVGTPLLTDAEVADVAEYCRKQRIRLKM